LKTGNSISYSKFTESLQEQLDEFSKEYQRIIRRISQINEQQLVTEFYSKFKGLKDYSYIINNYGRHMPVFKETHETLAQLKSRLENAHYTHKQSLSLTVSFFEILKKISENSDFIVKNSPSTKKYIPILRTIHANDYLQKGHIKETIKKNYEIKDNVFSGLDLYDEVMKLKNSGIQNRDKVAQFESFLSKHFFDKKTVEITSNSETKQLLFSIGGIEYPIYDIGDGIQSLIILLFPIFTANKNDWFFIEEPEINLHPGLQRIFIEALLNDEYLNTKNLKYFFTTHSNHFLDITLNSNEIALFQFKKQESNKFHIKTNVKPDKEILDVLGVNTSSVFLANTSIWVEGPTDRKYISNLLKLYTSSKGEELLKEDIDFAFFEYGGNLIEHYLFDESVEFNDDEVRNKINSFALSNKIFLLADNDNADGRSAKGKRRKALENLSTEKENFIYRNTIYREIENLLPKKIIKEFISELVKEEENITKSKTIEFERIYYSKKGLGEFYEELLLKNGFAKNTLKSFKTDSGTLMNDYKIKLSNFALNPVYKYEDFIEENPELEKLIESLYSFIKQ